MVAAGLGPAPAWAGSHADDQAAQAPAVELARLRAELQALEADEAEERAREAQRARRIEELKSRLDALAGSSNAPATTAAEAAPSSVKTAQAALTPPKSEEPAGAHTYRSVEDQPTPAAPPLAPNNETPSRVFEIYGFTQADYIQDFNRLAPDWEATLRPSEIPTVKGEFGSNGQSILSVRQSRFDLQAWTPIRDVPLKVLFGFDLFGVGAQAGETTFHLRYAYGEWGHLLAGQTDSLFANLDMFPNVIDYWGPPGMVVLRDPQIRWSFFDRDDLRLAVAIEGQAINNDPGLIRQIDPNLGANIQPDEKAPDFTAQFRIKRDWGTLQVSGVLRLLGYETLGVIDNRPRGNETGWGVNVGSTLKVTDRDKLIMGVVYGHGIASYIEDGGVDLAPVGAPGNLHGVAVPLLGLNFYLEHSWNARMATALGWGETRVANTSFQGPDAFQIGDYASINLLYTPIRNVLLGGEFLYGRRVDKDGAQGHDTRLQFSVRYDFATGNLVPDR